MLQQVLSSMGFSCYTYLHEPACIYTKFSSTNAAQAYRAAALRHHPDKNKGDVEGAKKKFQAAKDARDLLTDAKARAALDALLGCGALKSQTVGQQSSAYALVHGVTNWLSLLSRVC